MIEPPQIVETEARLIASIRLVARWDEMRAVMGPGVGELNAAVAAQCVKVTGPWFNHHFRRPTETLDFEICLPVASPVKPVGRVKPSELPAMRVARTVYHGGYEGLAGAWGELQRWIAANRLMPRDDFWECYVSGPESGADPAQWRTELNWPIAPD